ncbi:MAG: tRNA uridine-5-carboxymethylaminomethyl(34) synthesis GTPase MnmE [Bacteroidota bacterium]
MLANFCTSPLTPRPYLRNMHTSDTICALSSPPGIGAIALVRMTGPDAVRIAQTVFSKDLSAAASHKSLHGWVMDGNERVDDVLITVFRAPHSFTGEDTVEIACHGSIFIQRRILEILAREGAQPARGGEFTMRAFMNGKMDLSQAEAIGDLIASESAAAHKQAVHQMRGGFSKEINALREKLIHFASLVELELDFAEEDVEFANREQFRALLNEIVQVVDHLRQSFKLGNALKNGVPVAILGAPNAGKSTLLNALLNEERAIVSDIAGTTRDTIEEHITIEGVRFNFIDTAGIRDTRDAIESIGISRAIDKARSASVILLIFDATNTQYQAFSNFREYLKKEAGSDKHIIILANKTDDRHFDEAVFDKHFEGEQRLLKISAKQGTHIQELKLALKNAIDLGQVHSGETIVTNARHHAALERAAISLQEILRGLDCGLTGDLLAIDIRKTIYHLSEITGQVNADDLLHNIFSKFCIGK